VGALALGELRDQLGLRERGVEVRGRRRFDLRALGGGRRGDRERGGRERQGEGMS
jgi:hypothetical protein